MTNTTIYLAKIVQQNDYTLDTIVQQKAFDTLEKAQAYMTDQRMVEMRWGWVSLESAVEGTIEPLTVNW
jgi:hypothetical protein